MNDTQDSNKEAHSGSCLCGGVVFATTGPLRDVVACHCTQCRRSSGHFWAATSAPLERFRLVSGDSLAWFRSSPGAERGFCRLCGASLFWKLGDENRISIAAGSFDTESPFSLTRHIHTADAGDYYAVDGPPPAAGPGSGPETLECACLCGAVAFSLPGPAGPITACHCRQCRKLSGHYAASFDADEASVTFTRRAGLGEYQTAGRGCRGFCTRCGSSLFFRSARGEFSVEAGVVSGPTGGRLTEHIFVSSKGSYYLLDDGLPQR